MDAFELDSVIETLVSLPYFAQEIEKITPTMIDTSCVADCLSLVNAKILECQLVLNTNRAPFAGEVPSLVRPFDFSPMMLPWQFRVLVFGRMGKLRAIQSGLGEHNQAGPAWGPGVLGLTRPGRMGQY